MDDDGERWDAAQEGAELLRDGDAEAAVLELERVLKDDPENAYAYFFLGNAHFEAGRLEKALKGFVMALERSPTYVGAMVNAGHTLRLMGKTREALRMGRAVLERDKRDPDGLHLMALTHYARGDGAAAMDYLERFLATGPEVEVAQEAQGLLQVLRGEIVEEDETELN
jgi:cytochrome c-type biogenesis protein CcmH/NrfG